jgi:uncharacterized protein (TIGR00661 family)
VGHLKQLGHEVQVILSGRDKAQLSGVECFEPYRVRHGLTFRTRRGRIQQLETIVHLNLSRFFREVRSEDGAGYDLVITDFEPITARVARRFGIPSIGFGHQYAFRYGVPIAGWNPVSLWVLRHFAPTDIALGLHWHHFGHPILPPVVPESLRPSVTTHPRKVLVYLPFESLAEVEELLRPLRSFQFYVYGCQGIRDQADQDHLHLRPYSRSGFLSDLESCGGVICNAGFELLSEALHVGKKLLAKPLQGQMEQLSNALAISQLGLGSVMSSLDRRQVERWLAEPSKTVRYPNVARLIAHWIDERRWHTVEALATGAWSQTEGVDRLAC